MNASAIASDAIDVVLEWQHLMYTTEDKRRIKAVKDYLAEQWIRDGALSAGLAHNVALREAGGAASWGANGYGQAPAGKDGVFIKIGAGFYHSLALCKDRSVVFWGRNSNDEAPPVSLPGPYIDASAGGGHDSGFSIMLRVDGSVHFIGSNDHECVPPAGLPAFVAIAAGHRVCVGLTKEGNLWHWGRVGGEGQPPAGLIVGSFVSICVGFSHSLALTSKGAAVAFGSYPDPEHDADVEWRAGMAAEGRPGPFRALSAGDYFSVGLRVDNTIEAWGIRNMYGQLNAPTGTFVALAAGDIHGIALRPDGQVVGWGYDEHGQAATFEGAKRFALLPAPPQQ